MPQRLVYVIQRLSRCSTIEGVMLVLRQGARALTGAEGVTLVLREGSYCHYVDEDAIAPLWKGRRFPLNSCVSGWAMLHREQVSIPDIYADPRVPHDAYRRTFVKSLVMTPIRTEDPLGAVGVYWATHHEANAEELSMLQALADSGAVAIAHVQVLDSLKQANERKDAYLATLSHELRGPLAPIRTALDLLDRQEDPAAILKLHEIMRRQVQHLGSMLDDLLDVDRITRGKVELHKERLDLTEVMRQAIEDQKVMFEASGLTLRFHAPLQAARILGDPTRVAQILRNILGNAGKFTPRGGAVHVALDVDPDSGFAVTTVRDTGIGIAPEMLPQLYRVFVQADGTLDRAPGGLGLGLTVARGLAELHGGTVEVFSEGLGRGTEVTIRLPLDPAAASPREEPTREPQEDLKQKVLIIEDNRDAADTLELLLRASGHDASVAYTGPEGLEKARTLRPDVVLCDIGLPGMDGFEIASRLRSEPDTADMRLIAVTGYGRTEDRRRAMEVGFDAHLVKPVDPGRLLEHLGLQNRSEGSGA